MAQFMPGDGDKKPAKRGRPPIGADTEKIRNKRLPIFDARDRHYFPTNPAFHRVWVTDVRNQVQDYEESGFSFVTKQQLREEQGRVGEGDPREGTQIDSRVSINVGRAHTQDNAIAYLMQIPTEEWEEIRKMIAEERQAPMKQIGETVKGMKNDGFYGEVKQKLINV